MAQTLAVERYLWTILGGDATLQSLLGGNPPRIYAVRRPEDAPLPAVTFHFVSAPEDTKTDNATFIWSQPMYLIRVWYPGGDVLSVEPILDRIMAILDRTSGATSSGTVELATRVRPHGPFEPFVEGDVAGEIGYYYRFDVS